MYSVALSFPGYYLLKHRTAVYKASYVNKLFFVKEALMRTFLGLCLGFGVSLCFYGGAPPTKGKVFDAKGEELAETSLQYSAIQKNKF